MGKIINNFEIPCLTEEATNKNAYRGLVISLFFLFLSSVFYYYFGILDNYQEYYFLLIISLLLALYSVSMIWLFAGNIIITFRFLLLLIPILIVSYITWRYNGEVHIDYLNPENLTLKNTYILVYGGLLAATGSAMGWFSGIVIFKNKIKDDNSIIYFKEYINLKYKKIIYIGLLGSLFFGITFLIVSGGSLLSTGGYNLGTRVGVKFAAFGIFHIFFMSLVLIVITLKKRQYKINFMYLIFTFIFGILAGSRADYMLPILFLIIIMIDGNIFNKFYINSRKIIFTRLSKIFLLSFVGLFGALAFGFWRHHIDFSFIYLLSEYISNIPSALFIEINGYTIFWVETINIVIKSFYNVIYHISEGYGGHAYGLDYLYFIPRALPSIIRPEYLDSLIFEGMKVDFLFETAEAYFNFGFIGCFVVPFFISLFYIWLLKMAKNNISIFYMSWYILNGFMMVRIIWYQNNVLIRIATVMFTLYIVFYLLRQRWFFGINPIFKR